MLSFDAVQCNLKVQDFKRISYTHLTSCLTLCNTAYKTDNKYINKIFKHSTGKKKKYFWMFSLVEPLRGIGQKIHVQLKCLLEQLILGVRVNFRLVWVHDEFDESNTTPVTNKEVPCPLLKWKFKFWQILYVYESHQFWTQVTTSPFPNKYCYTYK